MSLFVVGSASHVGKSVTVAAICRCMVRRGIVVAPFKSQNMSLNSYVTQEGGEIGIAQAMQADAAKILPDADMNPSFSNQKGIVSHKVVLQGRPYKDIHIAEYYQETPIPPHKGDGIISTAEIKVWANRGGRSRRCCGSNLYDRDIANTQLAKILRYTHNPCC